MYLLSRDVPLARLGSLCKGHPALCLHFRAMDLLLLTMATQLDRQLCSDGLLWPHPQGTVRVQPWCASSRPWIYRCLWDEARDPGLPCCPCPHAVPMEHCRTAMPPAWRGRGWAQPRCGGVCRDWFAASSAWFPVWRGSRTPRCKEGLKVRTPSVHPALLVCSWGWWLGCVGTLLAHRLLVLRMSVPVRSRGPTSSGCHCPYPLGQPGNSWACFKEFGDVAGGHCPTLYHSGGRLSVTGG